MNHVPAHPTHAANLAELSIFTPGEIAAAAMGPLDASAAGEREFRHMIAWRSRRTGVETRDEPCDDPRGFAFPIATGGGSRCGIAWVDAVSLRDFSASAAAVDEGVVRGFETARTWLAAQALGTTSLVATVLAPGPIQGGSGAVAALAACTARALGLPIPADVAATGCLEWDGDDVRIASVDDGTIAAKVDALVRHGFRRVFVPICQVDVFRARAGSEFTVLALPADARSSLSVLLEALLDGPVAQDALLQVLLLIDRICVRSPHGVRGRFPWRVWRAVRERGEPLVRATAADVLSRRELHRGSPRAFVFDRYVASELRRHVPAIADAWLADHFDSHWVAQRAVCALDSGDWGIETESEIWAELDVEIAELERRASRRRERFAHMRDDYALLACRNTRSMRRMFLGRLRRDAAHVELALADRIASFREWNRLIAYGSRLGFADVTLRRQWNGLIDVLSSLADLGPLSQVASESLNLVVSASSNWSVFTGDADSRAQSFDIAAVAKLHRLGQRPEWPDQARDWLERHENTTTAAERARYPCYLPVEQIALNHPDDEVQVRAASLLEAIIALNRPEDPFSILWLLRFRTLAIIGHIKGGVMIDALRLRAEPRSSTPLGRIASMMVAGSLPEVVARCPY